MTISLVLKDKEIVDVVVSCCDSAILELYIYNIHLICHRQQSCQYSLMSRSLTRKHFFICRTVWEKILLETMYKIVKCLQVVGSKTQRRALLNVVTNLRVL